MAEAAGATTDTPALWMTPSARVDLAILVSNWRQLSERAPRAAAAGVVKANGYGLGAIPVARALLGAGCRRFYVAHAREGAALRPALGEAAEIAVLHGFTPGDASMFAQAQLQPVLNSPAQIHDWIEAGRPGAGAALHIDTGMNRLGVSESDWPEVQNALPRPDWLLTHLACADEPGHAQNRAQLKRFLDGSQMWAQTRRSLAATAGVYLGQDYHFDEVRLGVGLFGGGPVPPDGSATSDVVEVSAPVLMVRQVGPGQSVGYGATWTAAAPTDVAVVALGYADGFLRAGSNRGYGVIGGRRRPIIGRVSMDLIMIDVTGLRVHPGDRVEFLGGAARLREQASAAGAADYEFLVRLGDRLTRSYTGAG